MSKTLICSCNYEMREVKLTSPNASRFVCDMCGNAIEITAKTRTEKQKKIDDEYIFMHY